MNLSAQSTVKSMVTTTGQQLQGLAPMRHWSHNRQPITFNRA
jgi:hypothetical protein